MNRCLLALVACLPVAAFAQAPTKIPKDAPFCAAPDAPLLFLSPMGEPFRAKAGEPWPSALWFAQADINRDGRLSAQEAAADAARFFARLDTDKDGALIPEEVAAYEAGVPEAALYRPRADRQPQVRQRGKPDTSYGGAMGAGRYGWLNIPQPIWSADLDLDRAVTAAEFASAAARRFALLDKARTGSVSLAELGPTPLQAERTGPCRPRPPHKRGDAPDREDRS